MHKAREILRLVLVAGLKDREIAQNCSVSHMTVNYYRTTIIKHGLSFSQISQMGDTDLEKILKSKKGRKKQISRPQPAFPLIHRELQKKGVTLQLLWEEYKEKNPDGYGRTQFCDLYKTWNQKLDLTMRQSHKAGEKMFVDYSGQTVTISDPTTGDLRMAQIFVAVLGASNYTFAEATWSQKLPDFIASHINAFRYFRGVPELVIPDNLKSAVKKPCRYDPEINRTYHEMALHYGTVIFPARVRKPQDKSKVEVGVQIVQRWILAVLRNRQFFNLEEVNREISILLEKLNERPFKKLKGSRKVLFETVERPVLKALPQTAYSFGDWHRTRVTNDYHIELNGHYYSVPFSVVREVVEIRTTPKTVEVFFKNKRIASHKRDDTPGEKTTVIHHMPKSHQKHLEITPSDILTWARRMGDATHTVIKRIITQRRNEDSAYRSCLGVMRLNRSYPDQRIESACQRALKHNGCSYPSIRSILEKGLDQQLDEQVPESLPIIHPNIRGKSYFKLRDESIKLGDYLC